ncbi:hypothetical protein VCR31J2_380001 [Vibrio coralliirubri]|uniref:Uncharacterized protein n=1 Tax=Vibrio coralliirubri TaxID=1516159 RepID=A0AA87C2G7_9VIBR|nr:hypothetical protein VCR1J2_220390 [Vibrio coralliirubri]CDT42948.1 hypothetical protein VCR26J2_150309 [Vibrio coralliirubri]CDT86967.1 hypothetical protein VCR8J2_250051 [Vibrio coralliirubri]CDT98469.1 hypothetical protein VCR31J2_380001 [Vibrio coralliirubri]
MISGYDKCLLMQVIYLIEGKTVISGKLYFLKLYLLCIQVF